MFNGDARLCWKTLFQKRTITTTGNTTDYLEPISNTNANYQELSPNNIYHELNSNINYQELKIQYVEINQYQSTTLWSYAIYFLYVSIYKYFFSLGLKCHIFYGFNIARDCQIYFYICLGCINNWKKWLSLRLRISSFHDIWY